MSFNGTPIIEQINAHLVRITGITLPPNNAVGTIGLADATGAPPDIVLPADFRVPDLSFNGVPVSLAARVQVHLEPVSSAPSTPARTNLPPSIEKTGTTPADFRVAITNTNTGLETQTLEIYIGSVPKGGRSRVNIVGPIVNVGGGDINNLVEDHSD